MTLVADDLNRGNQSHPPALARRSQQCLQLCPGRDELRRGSGGGRADTLRRGLSAARRRAPERVLRDAVVQRRELALKAELRVHRPKPEQVALGAAHGLGVEVDDAIVAQRDQLLAQKRLRAVLLQRFTQLFDA